jgi:hypothetical protein
VQNGPKGPEAESGWHMYSARSAAVTGGLVRPHPSVSLGAFCTPARKTLSWQARQEPVPVKAVAAGQAGEGPGLGMR